MKITADILMLTISFPNKAVSINKALHAIYPSVFRLELYSRN